MFPSPSPAPGSFPAKMTLLAVTLLLLAACATPEIKKDVLAFSETVTTTTSNSTAAFELVEANYYQARVAQLVANYETSGFRPDMSLRFLPPEEIEIRTKALQTLEIYAEKLTDIMGDSQLKEFDTQTKAFGEGLLKLKDNKALAKLSLDANGLKIFTASAETLGHWFIAYKREKGLKEIVREMDGPVQNICQILVADIGAVPDSTGKGGHGLRSQLHNQYDLLLSAQDAFIQHNLAKRDPRAKREEISRLPALVREQQTADATLAATQKAVTKLAATHAELARSFAAPTPRLKALIRQLGDEGQRIGDFYKSLGKQNQP